MSPEKEKINYEEWHKKCRDFFLYFSGYIRNDTTPRRKLINLFAELEEIVFGEPRTDSWAI